MTTFAPAPSDILVVVDVQNDFCPGGALAVPAGDHVVAQINRPSAIFDHVVLTQDWHPPGHLSFASSHSGKRAFDSVELPYGPQFLWPDHCVQSTPGAAFHPRLAVDSAAAIVRKGFRRHIDSYSAFFENDRSTPTGLAGYLRERGFRRLFLCGLALDFCVRFTAEDACRCGFAVVIIEDACCGINTSGSLDEAMKAFSALDIAMVRRDSIAG